MDDLFRKEPEQLGLDMFDEPDPKSEWPDPEEIRVKLLATLHIAQRALDACPWDERTFKYHKTVFPQMANWLPDDEANQLRFEFAREVERIELLMAA
jgi:hypothetical protein